MDNVSEFIELHGIVVEHPYSFEDEIAALLVYCQELHDDWQKDQSQLAAAEDENNRLREALAEK